MTRTLLAIFVLTLCGCGVNEYQQRMDAQRARIQELDDTNALLDDPIEMPTVQAGVGKELGPAWPFPVFLRLPQGFGTTPKDNTPYYLHFFRYAGADPSYSLFISAAWVADTEAKQEELKKFTSRNFRLYVRRAIEDYYFKTNKFKLTLSDKVEERNEIVKPFVNYPDDAKPMRYGYREYNDLANKALADHSLFRAYFMEDSGKQICIVEQRPLRVPNETFDKAMKASLRTLDVGPDAASKRKKSRLR
jgi:hypothetical protein